MNGMSLARRSITPMLIAVALVVAACSEQEASVTTTASPATTQAPPTTSAPAPTTTTLATTTTAAASGEDTVSIVISGFAFSGPESIPVGTTVTVQNLDAAPHTWTSTDDVFASGGLGLDETFDFTFDEAGVYDFFCSIHPEMTGTITVEG